MSISISTKLLSQILHLPTESKASVIIGKITELVQFKKYHEVCGDKFKELNREIMMLRTEISSKVNQILYHRIKTDQAKIRDSISQVGKRKEQVFEQNKQKIQEEKEAVDCRTVLEPGNIELEDAETKVEIKSRKKKGSNRTDQKRNLKQKSKNALSKINSQQLFQNTEDAF